MLVFEIIRFASVLYLILGLISIRRLPRTYLPVFYLFGTWYVVSRLGDYYRLAMLPENPLLRSMAHWLTSTGQFVTYQLQYNNLPILQSFIWLQAVFLTMFFERIFSSNRYKLLARLLLPAQLLAFVFLTSFVEPLLTMNSISAIISIGVTIVLGFLYLAELYHRAEVENVWYHWPFWVTASFMLYVSGTFFQYLFTNVYLFSDEITYNIFIFEYWLTLFCILINLVIVWNLRRA